MKILIIDIETQALNFALRAGEAGHRVRVWLPPERGAPLRIGEGLVERVQEWVPSMRWADLVLVTGNAKYGAQLEPFFNQGFPIVGAPQEAAQWELDRVVGQQIFEKAGIETLRYEEFTSYDRAIAFVREEREPFCSKPWGGADDKSLSYVPETPEDLVCRLERWKQEGVKGRFLLQEKVKGVEMAAGTWFGPGGFAGWINETWEEKRLMSGGFGPNTGEMGSVLRYTRRSALFDRVCRPLEDLLHSTGFVGNIDVNCMVDESGQPWPLEFTMRFGWPAFNLMLSLHRGDPAEWLLGLWEGRDVLECETDLCCGVVMSMGDYPWGKDLAERSDGWPIRGLRDPVRDGVALVHARRGKAPGGSGGGLEDRGCFVSAGEYVLVAYGHGKTVSAAQEEAYRVVGEISWPPHKTVRDDIGCRLEEELPQLHKHGFATGMRY